MEDLNTENQETIWKLNWRHKKDIRVCRVICSDSVASPTLSSCSLKERNLPPRVRVRTHYHPLDHGKGGRGHGHRTNQQEKVEEEERNTVLSIVAK